MASTATYSNTPLVGTAFGQSDAMYFEHGIAVVCDATPSAVADCPIPVSNTTAGEIVAVAVAMPATGFPDSVRVTIKDSRGVIVFNGTITGAASKAERLYLSDGQNDGRMPFIAPLTVSHPTTNGNTTASATWSTYVMVA
jgi:hypothetical protein